MTYVNTLAFFLFSSLFFTPPMIATALQQLPFCSRLLHCNCLLGWCLHNRHSGQLTLHCT